MKIHPEKTSDILKKRREEYDKKVKVL